jgi:hypothetical protein
MDIDKCDIVQMVLKEMQLNYDNQYPKEVPNMDLIVDIIIKDIK